MVEVETDSRRIVIEAKYSSYLPHQLGDRRGIKIASIACLSESRVDGHGCGSCDALLHAAAAALSAGEKCLGEMRGEILSQGVMCWRLFSRAFQGPTSTQTATVFRRYAEGDEGSPFLFV
jgi:hypothetical protein